MGPYFPRTDYMSRADFESRGCALAHQPAPRRAKPCQSRLTVRAPRGQRIRRVTVISGRRGVARVAGRGRRRATARFRTRGRVRVVLETTRGKRIRFTRRVRGCR